MKIFYIYIYLFIYYNEYVYFCRVRNTTISRPSSAISTYSSLGGDIQNSDQNDQLDELDRIINERFTSTSILKSTINQQNNYSSNQDITSSIKHIDSDLSTSQLQRAKSPPPAYGVIERVKSQPIANTTATNYNNTNLASEKSDLPIFNYNADDNLQDLFDTDVASTMKSNEKIYSSENQTSSITGATRGVSLDLTQSNNNNSNNRVEIDLLKAKLAHAGKESVLMSNQLQLQSQLRDQQKSLEQRCQELSDQLFTLQAQYSESQSKIMVLEMECTKLREDSICVVAKHEEEIMYLQHRHDSELTHSQQQHTENITQIENRHTEMISALKQIHLDELNALKERTKQNASFEQVSNQMKLTSGSIKLMEEQLSERYRTMDIVRQGQFEARERLIGDLEEHARERTVAAESESLRLKGMLAHMESVITNLRGQGNEEKERLRLEHGRLQAMQMSLESEKNVWQRMCTEENISLRAKQKEA